MELSEENEVANEAISPKKPASPFGSQPTLRNMPESFLMSFASAGDLEANNMLGSFFEEKPETYPVESHESSSESAPKTPNKNVLKRFSFKATRKLSKNAAIPENERKRLRFGSRGSRRSLESTAIDNLFHCKDSGARRPARISSLKSRACDKICRFERRLKSCFAFGTRRGSDIESLTSEFSSLVSGNLRHDLLTSLAKLESDVLHHVAEYLPVVGVVRLTMVSRTLSIAMQDCPLRLDQLNKSLSSPMLSVYFAGSSRHAVNHAKQTLPESRKQVNEVKLTKWKIIGIKLNSEFLSLHFWSYLDLSRLVTLQLTGKWPALDFSFLALAPNLQNLDCGTSANRVTNLDALRNCHRLKRLYLPSCEELEDTTACIPKTTHLTEVCIRRSFNLTNISSMYYCTNLKYLDLSLCWSLKDLSHLRRCVQLENLIINDCTGVQSIDFITSFQKLVSFNAKGCVSIEDFRCLLSCRSLKTVSLMLCNSRVLAKLLDPMFIAESLGLFSNPVAVDMNLTLLLKLLLKETKVTLSPYPVTSHSPALPIYISYLTDLSKLDLDVGKRLLQNNEFTTAVCTVLELLTKLATNPFDVDLIDSEVVNEGVIPTLWAVFNFVTSTLVDDYDEDVRSLTQLSLRLGQENQARIYTSLSGLISQLCSNRFAVIELVENRIVAMLLLLVGVRLNSLELLDMEKCSQDLEVGLNNVPFKNSLAEMEENASSALLLIALVQECRSTVFNDKLLSALIRILHHGTNNASIEAAGAIWNLAASLDIGRIIVQQTEQQCLSALLHTLTHRPLKAKTQAVGALRNLAILNENKPVLLQHQVIEHLVREVNALIDPSFKKRKTQCNTNSLQSKSFEGINSPAATDAVHKDDLLAISTRIWKLHDEQRILLRKAIATLRILAAYNDDANSNLAQRQCAQFGALDLFVKVLSLKTLNPNTKLQRRAATVERTFEMFENPVQIFEDCAGGLLALSFVEQHREMIASDQGLDTLIHIVKTAESETLSISCCGCLWNLALSDELEMKIFRHGAIPALVSKIQHPNRQVVSKAVGALKNLSYQPEHKEAVFACKGDEILLQKLVEIQNQTETIQQLLSSPQVKLVIHILGAIKLLTLGSLEGKFALIQKGVILQVVNFATLNLLTSNRDNSQEVYDLVRYAVGIILNISEVLLVPRQSLVKAEAALCELFLNHLCSSGGCTKLVQLGLTEHPAVSQTMKGDARAVLRRLANTPLLPRTLSVSTCLGTYKPRGSGCC